MLQIDCGIGAVGASLDNLVINGGNLNIRGGEYGGPIGGNTGSGSVTINGGTIISEYSRWKYSSVGDTCSSVKINRETLHIKNSKGIAVGTANITNSIEVTGGNLMLVSEVGNFAITPTKKETMYI